MFSKKPSVDVKKSSQKFLDGKKDTPTRFKHLKVVLGDRLWQTSWVNYDVLIYFIWISTDNLEVNESKVFLEKYFNQVFHVFFDTFITTESTLKQKSKIFITHLPDTIVLIDQHFKLTFQVKRYKERS